MASHVSWGLTRNVAGVMALAFVLSARASAGFRFEDASPASLALYEGDQPVWVYNHGIIRHPQAPPDRARSCYFHPLYGLDGEVLTDDFPVDHYHHRGLFWAWPHVRVGTNTVDLWMLSGIEQRFERWLEREPGPGNARLALENGWYVGRQKVMAEQVVLVTHPTSSEGRVLDLELTWTPLGQPITLAGAEGKSYGGLTLRFAPRTRTVLTTPRGQGTNDLYMTRLPWADLSGNLGGNQAGVGAAILVAPDHPDYPPMWLTRHYGVLCLGWPGVEPKTLSPGQPIQARYRIWVHRGIPTTQAVQEAHAAYAQSLPDAGRPAPPPDATGALLVRAELMADRLAVTVGDRPFTEYLLGAGEKYPYFYPVLGPRSGQSLTTRRTEPYPHHSSLFFGCDRVNGGNYWQEGLDRGQIVSKTIRMVQATGTQIAWEQVCEWSRPGAEVPFTDHRRITLCAPSPNRRLIEFDVTLRARTKVRIEKTNHSLFAARMHPELAVSGGGALRNAAGDLGEQGTFGKPSPWADCRGKWHGTVEGVTLFNHPANRWSPPPWFTRDYGFFSPTPLNWIEGGAVEFEPGQELRLRYLVLVHADEPTAEELQAVYAAWSAGHPLLELRPPAPANTPSPK